MRKYGLDVWDNPFDTGGLFSIQVNDEVEIPLASKGTKIFFKSRVPNNHVMESCPKIEVFSSEQWNPASVNLQRIQPPHHDLNECNHYSVNDQYDYCEEVPRYGMTLSEATSIPLINEEKLVRYYDNDFEDCHA